MTAGNSQGQLSAGTSLSWLRPSTHCSGRLGPLGYIRNGYVQLGLITKALPELHLLSRSRDHGQVRRRCRVQRGAGTTARPPEACGKYQPLPLFHSLTSMAVRRFSRRQKTSHVRATPCINQDAAEEVRTGEATGEYWQSRCHCPMDMVMVSPPQSQEAAGRKWRR